MKQSHSEIISLIESVRRLGLEHTGCEPSVSCFNQSVDSLRMALENPPSLNESLASFAPIVDEVERRMVEHESSITDNFRGDDKALIESAVSLLALDAKGALSGGGIGGHARTIIESFVVRSKAKPKLAEPVPAKEAAIPEQWRVTGYGQIKKGDVISMVMAGRRICTSAKEVLNAGTVKEEVIYNRKKNHYFITSMVLDGTSNHKDVFIIPAGGEPC